MKKILMATIALCMMNYVSFSQSIKMRIPGILKDDPRVGGEKIDEFEFELVNHVLIGSATSGAGVGKASFEDIVVKKQQDASSVVFARYLVTGKMIQEI